MLSVSLGSITVHGSRVVGYLLEEYYSYLRCKKYIIRKSEFFYDKVVLQLWLHCGSFMLLVWLKFSSANKTYITSRPKRTYVVIDQCLSTRHICVTQTNICVNCAARCDRLNAPLPTSMLFLSVFLFPLFIFMSSTFLLLVLFNFFIKKTYYYFS